MGVQGCGDEADEISDDAASEGKDNGVSDALVEEHPVFDLGLSLSALGHLTGRDDMSEKPGIAGLTRDLCAKFELKLFEMEVCDIGISDQDVGGGRKGCDDGVGDISDEVKTTVD